MKFDWQTEEDAEWERPRPQPGKSPTSGRPFWVLFLLLLVLAGAFYGVRQVRDTVEEATGAVEEEVRTAHELARTAARQRDEELLVSLLSGRSSRWVDAQTERLAAGLLFENAARPFGLVSQGPYGRASVTLNPELTEALLESRNTFSVQSTGDLTATVTLTQTHVYRQGERRWLLSPPLPEFWGTWRAYRGQILSVTYPQRDEALAQRLARDIELSLEELCGEVATCPDGFDVRLRLETDPESVLLAGDGGERLSTGSDVMLPTPTLVGLPADEQAYQHLFRGYAGYVLSAALTEVAGYQCCQGVLFQRALLDLQMAGMDLAPDPVRRGEYLYLIDSDDSVVHLRRLWNEEEATLEGADIPLEVYAFLDFVQVVSGPSVSPFQIQRAAGDEVSFWQWLERVSDYELPGQVSLLQAEWSAYVREQVQQAQSNLEAGLGRPQPAQDVVLLCGDQAVDVYRLHNDEQQIRLDLGTRYQFGALAALPADDGYIVAGDNQSASQDPLETQLKLNRRQAVRLSGEKFLGGGSILPTKEFEPGRGRMVSWFFSSNNSGNPRVGLIDLQACAPGGCPYELLPGTPYWSPDNSQVLAVSPSRAVRLYLRGDNGGGWEKVADRGYQPFWLDNETFAYFPSYLDGRQRTVSAADIGGHTVSDFLTIDDLRPALPEDGRRRVLHFAWMSRHPFDPDALLGVVVPTFSGDQSYLVALRRHDGNVPWLEAGLESTLLHSFDGVAVNLGSGGRFSPSGRWLTLMMNYGQGPDDVGLAIYDLQNGEEALTSGAQEGFSAVNVLGDWSADGRWYVRTVPGAVDMIAPGIRSGERPLRRVISHNLTRCESPQWVNREQ